jgi:hypothetical protein
MYIRCRDPSRKGKVAFRCASATLGWWLAILVFLAVWALLPARAAAQERGILVPSNHPYPVLIDGEPVANLPILVKPGSNVCVQTTLGYLSEEERMVFQGWSHGPEETCVTLSQPGVYNIRYTLEVLLQVRSLVKEYRSSTWIARGTRTPLKVAPVVEERPGVRYSFEEWTGGESRFSTQNTIAPVRPITLEVKWRKEYLLELDGPEGVRLVGRGWHPAGDTVVLKAPATIVSNGDTERLQFARWEIISNPALVLINAQEPVITVKMDDTHKLQAVFKKGYLVVVESASRTIKKAWIPAGEEMALETPASIEVAPDKERLTFMGWDGADVKSAKGFLVVDRPLNVKALYDSEYYVKVASPFGGTGDGWYAKGNVATIKVPQNPSSVFFLRKVFAGYSGDAVGLDPVVQVPVTKPLTIIASYRSEVHVLTLSIVIGVLLLVGVVYLLTLLLQKRYKEGWRPFG